ncbi:hypothetical protein [Escherichia coli]|uniref:F4 family fimbrial subunit n=1 Tax=Escherichia coli TaxID=562 RepID=UPI000B7D6C5D|nr:hypothetical protein [Escherichia coli]
MKKTLIALAVTVSAVMSDSAMAALGGWSENTPENIEFGGIITVPSDVKWLWAVGEGFNSFTSLTSQLLEEGRKLNLPITQDMPLLAAKMKKAATDSIIGVIPTVTFSSYDSTPVSVTFTDASHASMTVKVKDITSGSEIGNITIPFEYGASASANMLDGTDNGVVEADSFMSGGAGTMFTGIVKPNTVIPSSAALKWNGLTVNDIYSAIKEVGGDKITTVGSVSSNFVNMSNISYSNYVGTNYARYFSYGAGITSGSELTLAFNSPVTTRTQWQAPLTITVSYS